MRSMTPSNYCLRYYYRFILVAGDVRRKFTESNLSTKVYSQRRKKQPRNTMVRRLKVNSENFYTCAIAIQPQAITQIPIMQTRREIPAVPSL